MHTFYQFRSSLNLDFCTFVLPELYELLQSQHKLYVNVELNLIDN